MGSWKYKMVQLGKINSDSIVRYAINLQNYMWLYDMLYYKKIYKGKLKNKIK